jgi:uncharacterized protein YggE
MIRTKAMLVSAAAAACLAGVAAGSIGAAQADTSTTATTTSPSPSPATITVNGAAIATVDPSANVATQHAGYLAALGSAVTDAQTKATALATQIGDKLGTVENLTEQSNYSGGGFCGNRVFASTGVAKGSPPTPGSTPGSPGKKGHHGSKPKATARLADVVAPTTCTIEADVTVTYAMAPA